MTEFPETEMLLIRLMNFKSLVTAIQLHFGNEPISFSRSMFAILQAWRRDASQVLSGCWPAV